MKGYFHEDALKAYSFLAADKEGVDFAEGETYDFARCVRPDGSAYGTRGKCRQGTEAGPADRRGTGRRGGDEAVAKAKAEGMKGGALNRVRAQGRKEAVAAARKEGGKKVSAKNLRARFLKEELDKLREKMKNASPEAINRLMEKASQLAQQRADAAAGK